jgi:hypothetical protein
VLVTARSYISAWADCALDSLAAQVRRLLEQHLGAQTPASHCHVPAPLAADATHSLVCDQAWRN